MSFHQVLTPTYPLFREPQYLLSLSNKIYAGTHLTSRAVKVTRGATVEAEPIHPWTKVLIDMDGETPGMLPLKATVLRGAITIRS